MERPYIADLIPYMPESIVLEIEAHGNPEVFGWNSTVEAWIRKSTHPFVMNWRNQLIGWTIEELRLAEIRQQKTNDLAREAYANCTRGSIRHRAVIDPFIKGLMEKTDRAAWTDPKAIADTEKQAPKMFINK